MLDSINEVFDTVSNTANTSGEPGLILIALFMIFALALGIPAVVKKSIKGVILAIFCTTFATLGTYFIFLKVLL